MHDPDPTYPTVLALSKIVKGDNPRRFFDPKKHAELVASIFRRGVLQPILLRPKPGTEDIFAIVAGERRYRAALEAYGPDGEIPVRIRVMTDREALEAAVEENDIRDDASETEQADAAVRILAACGNDRTETARVLAWSRAKLDRRLALANLSDVVKTALDERRIKIGHAELLAAVPNGKQDKALETILSAGLDVGKTRDLLMRVTQNLAGAAFDKSECTTCPFNSGAQRALFAIHVDDGHCTNPGCFQLKVETHEKAFADEQQRVADAAGREADDDAREDEAVTTSDDGGERTEGGTSTTTALGVTVTQPPAPASTSASKAGVTAKSIAARTTDLREAMWRTAVARALAGNVDNARIAILVAAMSGTLSHIKAETLKARAGLLIDATFPSHDFPGKIIAIQALPKNRAADVLSAIAAAYARDEPTFRHVACLALTFEVDLRDTWRVDQAFLERFTKDELKFIGQECGLVAHIGSKAFARLLGGKKADLVAGMLNATGFEWAGRLPSAMTLDAQYGPPPSVASARSEHPAQAIAA